MFCQKAHYKTYISQIIVLSHSKRGKKIASYSLKNTVNKLFFSNLVLVWQKKTKLEFKCLCHLL